MRKLKIEKGDRFDRLTVIDEADKIFLPSGQVNRVFNCVCDCGNKTSVRLVHLCRGRIRSCGCIVKTRKGYGHTLLCKVWRQMKDRCKENYIDSHIYFKKGISVCKEWENDFEPFRLWSIENGYSKGLQIDREDNSKGYSPENCRWVTPKVNCNNRDCTTMVSYKGTLVSFSMLLSEINRVSDYSTILTRIQRGWSADRAIDTPVKQGNYFRGKRKPKA